MSILIKVASATKPVKSGSFAICTDCRKIKPIYHHEVIVPNKIEIKVCVTCFDAGNYYNVA